MDLTYLRPCYTVIKYGRFQSFLNNYETIAGPTSLRDRIHRQRVQPHTFPTPSHPSPIARREHACIMSNNIVVVLFFLFFFPPVFHAYVLSHACSSPLFLRQIVSVKLDFGVSEVLKSAIFKPETWIRPDEVYTIFYISNNRCVRFGNVTGPRRVRTGRSARSDLSSRRRPPRTRAHDRPRKTRERDARRVL